MIAPRLQSLTSRIDSLELRERMLLLVAGLLVLFFLVDNFALQPTFKQLQTLQLDIASQEQQRNILLSRSSQLLTEQDKEQTAVQLDPQSTLDSLDSDLQSKLDNMLAPDHAARVLEQILDRNADLTLLELNARQTPMLLAEQDTDQNAAVAGISRYEFVLIFEGSYLATLDYLRALEAMPWSFFWEEAQFEVIAFPKARVTLVIYTLGLPGR